MKTEGIYSSKNPTRNAEERFVGSKEMIPDRKLDLKEETK